MAELQIPDKLRFLFSKSRYKVAYGGRGSGKSWNFGRVLLVLGTTKKLRILCARELQVSISDSVHKLLSDQVEVLGLSSFYEVQNNNIIGRNGTEFIFAGLRNNITKIKSMEGIDIVWCEEAEKISNESWDVLIPTIRKPQSEIWISFNPSEKDDPTYRRFVLDPPPDSQVVKVNWSDNPFFPAVLNEERLHLAKTNWDSYLNTWEGEVKKISNAQVLKGKIVVADFTPDDTFSSPLLGADWGFSTDPSVLIQCRVKDDTLYVEYEAYGVGVEVDHLPALFDLIPGSRKQIIRADSSRPETISYMKRNGFNRIIPVPKPKNSVEDGTEHLRSYYQIIIHPRCKNAIEELPKWSYKTDKLTGQILAELIDANNHVADGLRYALFPVIKGYGKTIEPDANTFYEDNTPAFFSNKQDAWMYG